MPTPPPPPHERSSELDPDHPEFNLMAWAEDVVEAYDEISDIDILDNVIVHLDDPDNDVRNGVGEVVQSLADDHPDRGDRVCEADWDEGRMGLCRFDLPSAVITRKLLEGIRTRADRAALSLAADRLTGPQAHGCRKAGRRKPGR